MRVLGVLGGRPLVETILLSWAKKADIVYAADSGADSLLPLGIQPVVTGDLDSVQSNLSGLRVVKDEDPDLTDCDKFLHLVKTEVQSPDLVIANIEGDRLDHILGSLSSILASGLEPRILLDTGYALPLQPNTTQTLPDHQGVTVSVLAFGDAQVTLQNCEWPLHRRPFGFGTFQSLSNVAHENFTVTVEGAPALLIINRLLDPWP